RHSSCSAARASLLPTPTRRRSRRSDWTSPPPTHCGAGLVLAVGREEGRPREARAELVGLGGSPSPPGVALGVPLTAAARPQAHAKYGPRSGRAASARLAPSVRLRSAG